MVTCNAFSSGLATKQLSWGGCALLTLYHKRSMLRGFWVRSTSNSDWPGLALHRWEGERLSRPQEELDPNKIATRLLFLLTASWLSVTVF